MSPRDRKRETQKDRERERPISRSALSVHFCHCFLFFVLLFFFYLCQRRSHLSFVFVSKPFLTLSIQSVTTKAVFFSLYQIRSRNCHPLSIRRHAERFIYGLTSYDHTHNRSSCTRLSYTPSLSSHLSSADFY